MSNTKTFTREYLLERVTVNPKTKCWEWNRSLFQTTGYGQVGGAPYTAHRLAYSLWIGDPTGIIVRHACHNRRCCNPAHLRGGTHGDNYLDSLPSYQAAWDKRRGVPAKNAISVTIDGVTYPSKVAAMKMLRCSPATLEKRIER